MTDELEAEPAPTAESNSIEEYIALAKAALRRWGGYSYVGIRENQVFFAGYIQACAIQALTNELARTRKALVESIDALPHAMETVADYD